jgi:hypothetical protein
MCDRRQLSERQVDQVDASDVARVVLNGRPEVVACLDGMEFFGQEDALLSLLRAAIVNLAVRILEDLDDEEIVRKTTIDVLGRAQRLHVAARAMHWEVESRGNPEDDILARSAGYRAEARELLHGAPPPLQLSQEEQEVVLREVRASKEMEEEKQHGGGQSRLLELETILEDLARVSAASTSWAVLTLPNPRFLEWLVRWDQELRGRQVGARPSCSAIPPGPATDLDVPAELAILRRIRKRLEHPAEVDPASSSLAADRPIFPRQIM